MFWFFGCTACGVLAPQPGIEPTPPALESEVSTAGLPGKSQAIASKTLSLEVTVKPEGVSSSFHPHSERLTG